MGKGVGFADELEDFDVLDVELEAAGGALVGADFGGDDDAGLLREGLDAVEDLGRDGGLGDDALDGAGAVAEDGEEELAGLAHVVEPAAEGDGSPSCWASEAMVAMVGRGEWAGI